MATTAPEIDDPRVGWPGEPPEVPSRPHGWFKPTHERVFRAVLASVPEVRCIIELGSWYGASTKWLAQHAPGAVVYAIDLWDDEFILRDDHYDKVRTMCAAGLRIERPPQLPMP
eukprot:scaffold268_cov236-Pinguiococcus_pyrenoidosus.AAC.22